MQVWDMDVDHTLCWIHKVWFVYKHFIWTDIIVYYYYYLCLSSPLNKYPMFSKGGLYGNAQISSFQRFGTCLFGEKRVLLEMHQQSFVQQEQVANVHIEMQPSSSCNFLGLISLMLGNVRLWHNKRNTCNAMVGVWNGWRRNSDCKNVWEFNIINTLPSL